MNQERIVDEYDWFQEVSGRVTIVSTVSLPRSVIELPCGQKHNAYG
jgi:hypothetical protein